MGYNVSTFVCFKTFAQCDLVLVNLLYHTLIRDGFLCTISACTKLAIVAMDVLANNKPEKYSMSTGIYNYICVHKLPKNVVDFYNSQRPS